MDGGVAFALLSIFSTNVFAKGISGETKKPFFSVVMPTYNRIALLPRVIESILNQTETDYELVILNDGSQDGTEQILKQYQKEYPHIRVITLPENKGVAHARNILNQQAKGDYIAIMDSDDLAYPFWLEKMHSFILEHPDIDIFIPKKEEFTDENLEELQSLARPLKNIFFGNSFENVGNIFKREFVLKHNIMYNPAYSCGEDWDFWIQMLLNGAKVRSLYHIEPLVMVRRHNENKDIYRENCSIAKRDIKFRLRTALNIPKNKLSDKDANCLIHNRFIKKFPQVFDEQTKQQFFIPCDMKYDLDKVKFKR